MSNSSDKKSFENTDEKNETPERSLSDSFESLPLPPPPALRSHRAAPGVPKGMLEGVISSYADQLEQQGNAEISQALRVSIRETDDLATEILSNWEQRKDPLWEEKKDQFMPYFINNILDRLHLEPNEANKKSIDEFLTTIEDQYLPKASPEPPSPPRPGFFDKDVRDKMLQSQSDSKLDQGDSKPSHGKSSS